MGSRGKVQCGICQVLSHVAELYRDDSSHISRLRTLCGSTQGAWEISIMVTNSKDSIIEYRDGSSSLVDGVAIAAAWVLSHGAGPSRLFGAG